MKKRIAMSVAVFLMSVAVFLIGCHTNQVPADNQTGTTSTQVPDDNQTGTTTTGRTNTFQTRLGTLTSNVNFLAGAKLKMVAPKEISIVFGFIRIDSNNAMPMKDSIEIHTGDNPDHPTRITLLQDLKSGKWLATDGYICYDDPKYMLLDGDTVTVIGGKDKPVYIEGQPFADTTVFIRNGKPHQKTKE